MKSEKSSLHSNLRESRSEKEAERWRETESSKFFFFLVLVLFMFRVRVGDVERERGSKTRSDQKAANMNFAQRGIWEATINFVQNRKIEKRSTFLQKKKKKYFIISNILLFKYSIYIYLLFSFCFKYSLHLFLSIYIFFTIYIIYLKLVYVLRYYYRSGGPCFLIPPGLQIDRYKGAKDTSTVRFI